MQFNVKLNALLIILAVNDFVPEQIRVIRCVLLWIWTRKRPRIFWSPWTKCCAITISMTEAYKPMREASTKYNMLSGRDGANEASEGCSDPSMLPNR